MDIAIIENGNGGDLKIVGNDFARQGGFGNMIYIALFGGNIEQSTGELVATQQDFSYWANRVLFNENESIQYNSLTERTLRDVPLTSAGRTKIQQAVERDLKFMNDFAKVTVVVSIEGVDRVLINIRVQELDKNLGTSPAVFSAFIFVWDATKQEVGDFRIQDFNDDFNV
jgi:hypothetical protein